MTWQTIPDSFCTSRARPATPKDEAISCSLLSDKVCGTSDSTSCLNNVAFGHHLRPSDPAQPRLRYQYPSLDFNYSSLSTYNEPLEANENTQNPISHLWSCSRSACKCSFLSSPPSSPPQLFQSPLPLPSTMPPQTAPQSPNPLTAITLKASSLPASPPSTPAATAPPPTSSQKQS